MAEEVAISNCKKYINIRSHGSLNVDETKSAIEEVMSINQNLGISKVMVNARQRNKIPSSGQSLDVAKFLAELTNGEIKFAILIEDSPAEHHFFETATTLHGGLISYFNDESLAIEWLNAS